MRGNAARVLGAQSAAEEGFVVRDDYLLGAAAALQPVRAAELDGALDGFRSGGQQEDFLERIGKQAREPFHQTRANLAWKTGIGQQPRGCLASDGVNDFLAAMTGGPDHDAA